MQFVDGQTLTRWQLLDDSRRVAGGLRAAGIGPGDRVAIMSGNRPEFLTTFFAISMLGAVSVPLNTALQGDVLTYMLQDVGPCSLIIESDLLSQASSSITAGGVQRLWIIGTTVEPNEGRPFEELEAAAPWEGGVQVEPWDLAAILYTSGTTGRSKGVMWSHQMALSFSDNATWVMGYTANDVAYTCLPLYHINALFTSLLPALREGGSVAVSKRFSASRYWSEIVATGATVTNMLGVIGSILWKQSPSPEERQHRLRLVLIIPFPAGYREEFEARFGVKTTELYGSTDTGIPLGIPFGQKRPESCGIAAPGWEVDIVDPHDSSLPPGVAGELVTRPISPFVGQLGYWNQPEKTWEAHRNCWFHTGDIFVRDDEGWYSYKDRQKDAMRVSGENVSSFEVEQVLVSHPAVAEAAVYAVPSELGEDSIMAAIVLEKGFETISVSDLIAFCVPRMAYFSVPRYVDFLPSLPKTSTLKVRKSVLRERGVSKTALDVGQRRRSQMDS